ncbi:MAG: hypothetical protein J3K34DRAFT_460825 [Monoraphidium minutum]|nr:MAG: hypothetical protein J3K34DRAFT_460825 [Monoraphidium minutum]
MERARPPWALLVCLLALLPVPSSCLNRHHVRLHPRRLIAGNGTAPRARAPRRTPAVPFGGAAPEPPRSVMDSLLAAEGSADPTLPMAAALRLEELEAAGAAREMQRLADSWRLTPAQAAAIGEPWGAGRIRICITHFDPLVHCNASSSAKNSTYPGAVSGFWPEAFRILAAQTPWLAEPRRTWFFSCMLWNDLMDDLAGPNGTCLMAPTGVNRNPLQMELRDPTVSWPVVSEALMVLMRSDRRRPNPWSPFLVFRWNLWLSLGFTAVIIGAIVTVYDLAAKALWAARDGARDAAAREIERLAAPDGLTAAERREAQEAAIRELQLALLRQAAAVAAGGGGGKGAAVAAAVAEEGAACEEGVTKAVPPPPSALPMPRRLQRLRRRAAGACAAAAAGARAPATKKAFSDNIYFAVALAGKVGYPRPETWPARVLIFCFGLMFTVVVALYSGATAAALTAQAFATVRGLGDLRGARVATWSFYADEVAALGVTVVPVEWHDPSDEARILGLLTSGAVEALVVEEAFAHWAAARDCGVAAAGQPFLKGNAAISYSDRMPQLLRDDLDDRIMLGVNRGLVDHLYSSYVVDQIGAACVISQKDHGRISPVSVKQTAGLWLLLLVGALVGALLLGCHTSGRA